MADWDICPNCLEQIIQINTCTSCGKEVKGTWKICPSCKTPTGNTATAGHSQFRTPTHTRASDQPHSSSSLTNSHSINYVEFTANDIIADRYFVKNKIGQGGFGKVYEVHDQLTEKTMALKTLPYVTKESINNILLEFESRERLNNTEHIIKAYQPQQTNYNGQNIIIYPMELADISLRSWLVKTQNQLEVRLEEGLEIFKQACKGVEAIHESGLIHLDLKPENILLIYNKNHNDLSQKWKVKISDFGLARGIGMGKLEILNDGVGTPAYMAPEQILAARWKDVGKEADIYSLGMILYEMIDGDLPYSGSPKLIKEKKLNPLIEITPLKSTKDIAVIAMKCLEHEKKNRIESISELIYAIDEKRRFETKLRLKKNTAEEYFQEVKRLIEQGKYTEAKKVCIEAGKWDSPESPIRQWRNLLENIEKIENAEIERLKKGEMILVEGGKFNMGSNEFADEKPIRVVELKDFLIDKYPVTVKQFREFCKVTGRSLPNMPSWGWIDDHPIVNVNWNDANEYAKWASKRLPTEAEWEYAARGGNKSCNYKFSGSNNINEVAWYIGNSNKQTNCVGNKLPNELGIHDMSGNINEWCNDWYGSYKNLGHSVGRFKVLRGGSWKVNDLGCRTTLRISYDPDLFDDYFGFRCVKDLES